MTAAAGRPGGADEARGTGSTTRRDERLLEEIESLKAHIRQLEVRIDALTGRPKAGEDRIRVAIEGFDEILEGGIPVGHVIIIGGPSGTMKTSLALNLLHKNQSRGVRGVYVSLEEGRNSLLRTMSRLGIDTKDDFVVDIGKLRTEHEAADETRDWLQILKDYLVRRHEKDPFGLVVIDPVNSLYSLAEMNRPRTDLFHFFSFLRGLGLTAILITESEGDLTPFPNHEDFLADGAIQLRYASDPNGRVDLHIRCVKMRHTNHSRDWFRLDHVDRKFVARPVGD